MRVKNRHILIKIIVAYSRNSENNEEETQILWKFKKKSQKSAHKNETDVTELKYVKTEKNVQEEINTILEKVKSSDQSSVEEHWGKIKEALKTHTKKAT